MRLHAISKVAARSIQQNYIDEAVLGKSDGVPISCRETLDSRLAERLWKPIYLHTFIEPTFRRPEDHTRFPTFAKDTNTIRAAE